MQPSYVMAFRKRLRNRGYTDISIYSGYGHPTEWYHVVAVEPLSGKRVETVLHVSRLREMFR